MNVKKATTPEAARKGNANSLLELANGYILLAESKKHCDCSNCTNLQGDTYAIAAVLISLSIALQDNTIADFAVKVCELSEANAGKPSGFPEYIGEN